MANGARAFVTRHTRLQSVPGLDGLRLHLSDDVFALWGAVQKETGDADAPIPYWAFAWGGGLAIARYLGEHPETVRGRRVLDVASGSGLCAIAAMRAGASEVTAVDIDRYSIAAVGLNARANREMVEATRVDVLDDEPPDMDVILAGDCWYEETFATRMTTWLQRAAEHRIQVLIGDPGRRYLNPEVVTELASYEARSTTDLEDLGRNHASVYSLLQSGRMSAPLTQMAFAGPKPVVGVDADTHLIASERGTSRANALKPRKTPSRQSR